MRDAGSYGGDVWTDGRGLATVHLPAAAAAIVAFDFELTALDGTPAHVVSHVRLGQFTIQTDEPHVKVAWRLTERTRGHARRCL